MQFDERKPDRTETLKVAGYDIYIDTFGSGDEVLLCLNGGPGLPCDYLREPHAPLADLGYRVVAFDQLGCGRSDKPQDRSLWTIERYVEEVETVAPVVRVGGRADKAGDEPLSGPRQRVARAGVGPGRWHGHVAAVGGGLGEGGRGGAEHQRGHADAGGRGQRCDCPHRGISGHHRQPSVVFCGATSLPGAVAGLSVAFL